MSFRCFFLLSVFSSSFEANPLLCRCGLALECIIYFNCMLKKLFSNHRAREIERRMEDR